MGSVCLFRQYLDSSDLLLAAQQTRRCGGPVDSCIDGIDWPLQVLFLTFHLVSSHICQYSLPQILQA